MTLQSGTRLGPYEILSPLGAGGMGEVYRARDPRLGREVAVKVLPAALSSDPDRLRRFEQEARAAGALSHPNLLTIFDVGTSEADPHKGAPYLVSELLEGETLRERLSGGPLPVRKAIDYAIQAAQGLAAAHEKGIIHRDLKPENLFVTHEGRLKILDFGLAKLKQVEPNEGRLSEFPTTPMRDGPGVMRETEPGVVMGTMGYMSPEQVRGQVVDHRSDLFSLGAILYEMLAGRQAFHGATAADTMSAILKEDPPELSASGREVPPALIRMVAHCLEKTPQQRYQSARDLAFALETLSGITSGSGAVVRGAAGFGESALATAIARLLPRSGWPRVSMVAVALALAAGAGILAGLRLGTKSAEGLGSDSEPARVSYHRLTFRRGSIPAARFAPDGRTVVYSGAWDGALPEIFLTSPDSPESRALGVSGADLLGVSSSGELAVLLRPRWEGNYYLRLGTLARLPLAGGAPRQVLEDVRYADWAPDGKSLAIVRGLGDRERLEYPIGKSLYETSARIVSPRISPAGDRIAFFEMRPGECSVKVADHSGEVRTLSGGWVDWWYLTWSPDGEEVWFAASPKGSSSPIYAVDLSGRLRVLAKAPGSLEIHDVSREGRALVTRVSIRSFMAGRTPGGRVERDLSWLDGSRPVDVSGDGRTLLFMEMFEAGGQYSGIYIRSMDGAPPVRLGEGRALGLSPDGQWVLAYRARDPKELLALPTGPGEARRLKTGALEHVEFGEWLPDGRQILISGNEPGGRARLYLLDFEGGEPQPLIHEGFSVHPAGRQIAPDGRHVAAIAPDGSLVLCPTGEGKPQPVRGTLPGDRPIQWSPDGRLLYLFRQGELPGRIFKVDLASGRRELFRELRPLEMAGVSGIDTVIMTPDGQSYFYSYGQPLAELYLVEGLR